MSVDQLHNAARVFADLKEQWDQSFEALVSLRTSDGTAINTGQTIPGASNSISELNERIIALHGATSGFKSIQSVALAPDKTIAKFSNYISVLSEHVEILWSALSQYIDKKEVSQLDTENMEVNGVNIGTLLNNVSGHSNSVAASYLGLSSILGSTDYPGFSAALNQLSSLLDKSAENLREIDRLRAEAADKRGGLVTIIDSAAKDRTLVADALKNVTEDRNEVARNKETAQTQVAETESVVQKANELQAIIDTYKSQFDAYQSILDAREAQLLKAEDNIDRLIQNSKEHDANILNVIENANSMIAGATNAGLATTFSKQYTDLNGELTKARWGFFFSIALLAISALPIVAYIFPGIANFVGLTTVQASDVAGETSLVDLFSRLVLLIPFAWLAKFMAARHATLFRLRENYAFKYSMAMSVEGFKQQAPSFKDDVAMATFSGLSDISALGTYWFVCVVEDFRLIVVTEGNEDETEIDGYAGRSREGCPRHSSQDAQAVFL